MKLSESGANNFKFSSENHVSPILFLLAIPTQLTKDKKNFLMPYHKQNQKEIHHVIAFPHYTQTY